ncbi:hypothetical protein K461DRAFT_125757 [Myriangium duriaei CBS 260.36]|uniref:Secreted protein n=1 Tax=Myriangium duriaei CBS 260.36 TaxID=1168546 RepID=A0A9P4MIG8_9PEZI|nr:hypothetical protein K461DRAFT_125757 [Myriangium duriaei CBS 260.36]
MHSSAIFVGLSRLTSALHNAVSIREWCACRIYLLLADLRSVNVAMFVGEDVAVDSKSSQIAGCAGLRKDEWNSWHKLQPAEHQSDCDKNRSRLS